MKYNAVPALLKSNERAIKAFVQRDLLGEKVSIEELWTLPEPQRILKRQAPKGSWLYPGIKEHVRTQENYNQIETYRILGILVEKFGFNKKHPSIQKAAEYLFRFQTQEGDFRGIYGNQLSPNYSAGITELLIKAGYGNDARIQTVFEWLISIRQKDGGWAIPFRTQDHGLSVISNQPKTITPDIYKPFSHMVTGVVLRAFAVHPAYRKSKESQQAGKLLVSSLFKKDYYPDRAKSQYWLRFSFPFWFTDLVSATDSLSQIRISKNEPQIDKALEWFINNQQENGLWKLKITKGRNRDILQLWLTLAICRIFNRFYR